MINDLKNILIGFEGDIFELDNKMMSLGFYSEGDADWKELLESECVNYTFKTCEPVEDINVVLDFNITIQNSLDESEMASNVIITNVR